MGIGDQRHTQESERENDLGYMGHWGILSLGGYSAIGRPLLPVQRGNGGSDLGDVSE
jgi:hypothetical protein